ncbi:hypothetical protein HOA92_06800 [archaeon]|jgi:hypothetical protein|nr:hypothetical protein [archaeon]MBT6762721.1 hypothetical protein [archaeon]
MNLLLPLILLIIANFVLYWVFFGKKNFDKKMQKSIFGESNDLKDNLTIHDPKSEHSNHHDKKVKDFNSETNDVSKVN